MTASPSVPSAPSHQPVSVPGEGREEVLGLVMEPMLSVEEREQSPLLERRLQEENCKEQLISSESRVTTVKGDEEEHKTSQRGAAIDFTKIGSEIKSFKRSSLSVGGIIWSVVSSLLPTVWDMGSDFALAGTVDRDVLLNSAGDRLAAGEVRSLIYLFISLPGIVLAFSGLQSRLARLTDGCCQGGATGLRTGLALFLNANSSALAVALIVGLVTLFNVFPSVYFYLAVANTVFVLGVKLASVFLRGPEMTRLGVRVTAAEAQFEASLQLFLTVWLWWTGGAFTFLSLSSGLSSVIMIGKASTDSYITFSEEKARSSLRNCLMLLVYSPVFVLTALFRIGSLAVVFRWGRLGGPKQLSYLSLALLLPLLVLLVLKFCQRVGVTVGEILEGVTAELTTVSMWGGRLSRGARARMQVAMASHLLLLNTIFLLLVVTLQVPPDGDFWRKFLVDEAESFWDKLGVIVDDWKNILDQIDDLSEDGDPGFSPSLTPDLLWLMSVFCLACGWLSYPLLVCQMTSSKCCCGCSKS